MKARKPVWTDGLFMTQHHLQQQDQSGPRENGQSAASSVERIPESDDSGPASGPGNVEDALAFALVEATKAQQWGVVAQLASELKARREGDGR